MRLAAVVLALASGAAAAAEVTVFRPAAFIGQEWAYYVVVDGKPVTDVFSGERATFQVPPETRTLVIHCPKAMGGYEASRIDYDFSAHPKAYFALSARPECVNIQPVEPPAVAALTRETRPRIARPLEYDPAPRMATKAAPATAPLAAAAPSPASAVSDSSASVAAATAAWVDAFNSRDPARISGLYDSDAVLSDATEAKPRVGASAISDYYKSVPERPTQRVALGEHAIRLYGDTAIDSGTYNLFEMRGGEATVTPARYTLVYRQRGGKWVIVDHQTTPAAR
jgi:uncharacterized protein (TIGR02246 family)